MPIHVLSTLPPLAGDAPGGTAVRQTLHDVQLVFDPPLRLGQPLTGTGDLIVAESQLMWWSSNLGMGLAVDYPTIAIHATSRDDPVAARPCVYCQLTAQGCEGAVEQVIVDANGDAMEEPMDEAPEQLDNDDALTELRIIPKEANDVETIFLALSECAALHPDPDMVEDEAENEWFTEESDAPQLTEAGQSTLARLESIFNVPIEEGYRRFMSDQAPSHEPEVEGQFDDAPNDPVQR